MQVLRKIGKVLFLVVAVIVLAQFVLVIGTVLLFKYGGVNSYDEALQLMKQFGPAEYNLMIDECAKLIESGSEQILSGEKIPPNLKVLSPEYVRYSERNCEVNLHKVPGTGMGYFVSKAATGEYKISWHNYFESWESHEISIAP